MDKSLNDGTYSVVAKGYEGNSTKLKVIVANHRIEQIIPEKDITPNTLEDAVFTQIPEQIINHQTLDVDALTGASYSSQGLLDAVAEVVKQAGGSVAKFRTEEHDTTGSQVKTDSESSEEYGNWIQRPNHIDKKVETDFLIIGAGISGLAAAVQAGEEGIKTTVIEKNSFVAGNGGGVEGIFGINTDMQKAAGIHAEKEEIIAREQELGQYRADGSFWVDLVNHSAENIDWLLKEGVQLTKVDDYHGTCAFPTFHWFKGGFASEGYVPYMKKRADELGIDFILNASADGIIYDGDRVAGAYVTTPKGKLEIDAKATLLATGGVGHNPKLIAKQGWQTKNLHYCSMPSNTGDGYMMAMAVGAKDMLNESAEFMMNYIQALPHEGVHLYIDPINGFMSLPSGGPVMFVNQDGVRLVNENVKKDNLLYQRMAIKSTKVTYEVFNQKVYDSITQGVDNADQILADAVKRNEGHSLYKADTFDQLAKAVGLPEATFVDTVKRYNQYAINGKDEEFNKDPAMLVALDEGPYYIARLDPSNLIGIGGVASNRQFEVIKDDFEKVPGLYVSGMDSTMQYRSVYTITLGGSACAHNVNSGRHAAMNAKKYMASLKS
ncbi:MULTISPECIES: FAD-dependent oxidoreductase [Lactiplantibacillus]|uniref:Urocanate reductase n=1 Tax=Lactiplantibacillus pentosus TaxID=1589 RepID=A0ABD7IQ20_LACPE|nr:MULTISPECIES: FAD-dependent oxidoreductase [Lactiplantibacillus]MCC3163856.1 FAD-dependent oxidoreductase [Lactiplantibacillus pentosus]MCJ8188779.1 FAD-dependent oxidoreductase [Lactiplantibacillus pentosus]MCM8609176.1 FAD-dependent oxidoreductase [Lactiplantibacillus sp. B652]PRO95938.1 FAD-binding dehydrogenase [Lactiplantibacillus pentosus]RMW47152.1 FAD-dependent oxidoreductase [Lactiplantibacillus pentosus]